MLTPDQEIKAAFKVDDVASQPAGHAAAVTKSDTAPLSPIPRALYVGVTGDVAVKFPGAVAAMTFKAVPAGAILPIRPQFVMSTNTTATDIVALW